MQINRNKIQQETVKFLTSIKDGGFFKTLKEGEPFLVGFANEVTIDQYEDNWHGMKAAFFYSFYTKTFHINEGCGCMYTSRAVKPSVRDLMLLKNKLAEHKAIFNRKTKEIHYDNRER